MWLWQGKLLHALKYVTNWHCFMVLANINRETMFQRLLYIALDLILQPTTWLLSLENDSNPVEKSLGLEPSWKHSPSWEEWRCLIHRRSGCNCKERANWTMGVCWVWWYPQAQPLHHESDESFAYHPIRPLESANSKTTKRFLQEKRRGFPGFFEDAVRHYGIISSVLQYDHRQRHILGAIGAGSHNLPFSAYFRIIYCFPHISAHFVIFCIFPHNLAFSA